MGCDRGLQPRGGDAPSGRLRKPPQKRIIDEIHDHRFTVSPSLASAVAVVADCRAVFGCRSRNHAAIHVHVAMTARIQIGRARRGATVAHDTVSRPSPGAPAARTVGNVAKTSIALVPPWA